MSKTWSTTIKPKTGIFNIPIKEIIQYRGLIFTLVKRNYEIQYKQTILGPVWMIIGLIFSSGIFSFVFGYVGRFSSDGTPYFLFYMTGALMWEFFSACFNSNKSVLIDNSYLYGKVYFPRLIMPVANVIFEAVRSAIKFAVCLIVWGYFLYKGEACFCGIKILWLVPISFSTALMGMSCGLVLSCLTIKYRDFNHLTGIAMSLLLYASPVLYSTSQLPQNLQKLVYINPMSSFIEAFRYYMIGSGVINGGAIIYSIIFTILITLLALIMFNQTEKTFVDIV